jgi:hypothetical protein
VTTGSNQGATAEPGEPRHAGGGGKSVWWRWRAPAGGDTIIATLGSDFDTVLAVYRGRRVGALTEIASNDDAPNSGVQSMVRFNAVGGVLYRIAVGGFRGAEGNIPLMFANLAALPPLLAASHSAPGRRCRAPLGYGRQIRSSRLTGTVITRSCGHEGSASRRGQGRAAGAGHHSAARAFDVRSPAKTIGRSGRRIRP